MVAINFKKEFAAAVESGEKRQTIREKCRAYTGCKLQLYYGQRTKQCRKLLDAVCKSTCSITVTNFGVLTGKDGHISDVDAFARKDGFKDYAEMWKFFEPRAEAGMFNGFLIEW